MEDYSQMPVNERIKILIIKKFFTQAKLSELVGVKPQTVSEHLNKKGDIPAKYLTEICKEFPDIRPAWLLTGIGGITGESEVKNFKMRTDKIEEQQDVPLYDFEASAGLVELFGRHNNVIDFIKIPNIPKCDGAIHITGDSMYPLLKSGDIVMYQILNDKRYIFYGEMYLISFELDSKIYTLVKYIQKSSTEGFIKLASQNQYHDPFEIPLDNVRALALVKASIRINSMS
ncbi:LexA family transcriptional regulator [Adhaeribacter aquaticus]|uniref:LexA family transcriptional regulator n=1 Tax=Adhaeribacter aquaticus TaxID=299567 RepID=UPI00068673FC|nr:S24 family peptidase [Adhaeribacter aquaticus]